MAQKLTLSVILPVYNEEKDVPRNVPILYKYLKENFTQYSWELIIADNGPSKDRTPEISKELTKNYRSLFYICIPRPGRGGALKEVWQKRKSDYLCYMDVDLSSDLSFLSQLISFLENGADIAIGSRLKRGAKVYGRTLLREIMSRGYNILIRTFFWTSFCDAQCGFKAIRKEAAMKLLPYVEDKGWFFDSELLITGEKAGFKIKEVPIVWRDDPASTVKVAKTAWGDIKGLARLFITRPWKKIQNSK
ncbi:MAG: glycosyltransferase family 2 protein [Candidatus Blackburnbacteria bacterium]|nr:glycosyltransferase family 2 protein [Candidatus Blackburnbacteria bacterium]